MKGSHRYQTRLKFSIQVFNMEAQENDYSGKQLSLLSSHAKLGTVPVLVLHWMFFKAVAKADVGLLGFADLGCTVKPKVLRLGSRP